MQYYFVPRIEYKRALKFQQFKNMLKDTKNSCNDVSKCHRLEALEFKSLSEVKPTLPASENKSCVFKVKPLRLNANIKLQE